MTLILTIALTPLTLMVTVSSHPNPTYSTNPTNHTATYRCEFDNINCTTEVISLLRLVVKKIIYCI